MPSNARHLEVRDQQVVRETPASGPAQIVHRRRRRRRSPPVPASSNSRSRMLASSSTTSTLGRPSARTRNASDRCGVGDGRRDRRLLALEPRVDVALAEPPLAAYPNRRNLACFDQPVDRAQVDVKVVKDLFSSQKRFVDHRPAPPPSLYRFCPFLSPFWGATMAGPAVAGR